MGQHDVSDRLDGESRRRFMRRLIDDVHALETMIDEGLFETGVRRIGVEQEMFLADEGGRPVSTAMDVLAAVDDAHFTTELAQFNLELNLEPVSCGEGCLSALEDALDAHLRKVEEAAGRVGTHVVITGILPSLRKSDMGLENMTPLPRYAALNKATNLLHGGPRHFRIKGVDELKLIHDSVMLESCNASLQVHLQVSPDEFVPFYNATQAYSAPLLAAAANSPLLFGQRLWQETRIALFQQAVDTRQTQDHRVSQPRVQFGRRWLEGSVIELYKEDISRFRALMSTDEDEDPFECLRRGELPRLKALTLHSGTIWRWNRACYGITGGKPHLRIENRVLPSGPTIRDEMANIALWIGLMAAEVADPTDFTRLMPFEQAKENFIAAARQGMAAQFNWLDDRTVPAQQLLAEELLPRARRGLAHANIAAAEIDRHLGVLEERVSSGRTGARWLLLSLASMDGKGTASERLSALTRAAVSRQFGEEPVHRWPLARLEEAGGWQRHYVRVEQYMTTDLFTVGIDDSIDLVANLMDWQKVRHVPVEDDNHRLLGLISHRDLLRVLAKGTRGSDGSPLPVSSIMKADPVTVSPETETLAAIELMRDRGIGCLPVVKDGRLVGVVTERDFMVITRELLVQKLKE